MSVTDYEYFLVNLANCSLVESKNYMQQIQTSYSDSHKLHNAQVEESKLLACHLDNT